MPVVQDLADMYKAVDAAATVNLLAKLAVEKSYHAKLDDTRSSLAVCLCHHACMDTPHTCTDYATASSHIDAFVPHAQIMSPHTHRQILTHIHTECRRTCTDSVELAQAGSPMQGLLLPVGLETIRRLNHSSLMHRCLLINRKMPPTISCGFDCSHHLLYCAVALKWLLCVNQMEYFCWVATAKASTYSSNKQHDYACQL